MNELEKLAKPLVNYLRNNKEHIEPRLDQSETKLKDTQFDKFKFPANGCVMIGEDCIIKSGEIKLPPGEKIIFESL